MSRRDGSVSTELVLITPVLLVLLGFVVMTGRIGAADTAVGHAAQQAARAASMVGTAESARTAAHLTARANLDTLGVACRDLHVEVDTSRLAPGGEVAVALSCTVDLADVVFAGLPGQRQISVSALEVVDRHRGVGR